MPPAPASPLQTPDLDALVRLHVRTQEEAARIGELLHPRDVAPQRVDDDDGFRRVDALDHSGQCLSYVLHGPSPHEPCLRRRCRSSGSSTGAVAGQPRPHRSREAGRPRSRQPGPPCGSLVSTPWHSRYSGLIGPWRGRAYPRSWSRAEAVAPTRSDDMRPPRLRTRARQLSTTGHDLPAQRGVTGLPAPARREPYEPTCRHVNSRQLSLGARFRPRTFVAVRRPRPGAWPIRRSGAPARNSTSSRRHCRTDRPGGPGGSSRPATPAPASGAPAERFESGPRGRPRSHGTVRSW